MTEKSRSLDLVATLMLILGIIAAVGPFWFVFVTASQSFEETLKGLSFLPGDQLFTNIAWVFQETLIPRQLLNSVIVALMVTFGKSIVAFFSAFALVYFNLRGKNLIFALIIATLMLPLEMRIVPTYTVAANVFSPVNAILDVTGINGLLIRHYGHGIDLEVGILDTHIGMALPLIATATGTFLFRQFFQTLPPAIVEAAQLLGAGPIAFLWHILLPMSRGPFIALGVMMFLGAWNQYLWPLIVTTDPNMRPVAIGLAQLSAVTGAQTTEYNHVMAAALLVVVPPLIVIASLQRYLVKGLVVSGH